MGEILLSHRSKHLRDHSQNQSNRGKGGIPFGYERLTPEDIEMVAMLTDLWELHECS